MSTRDDFVPPEYLSFFKQLQDAAPPRPFEHVKSVIEREIGREMRAVFKEFEETACGAALRRELPTIAAGSRWRDEFAQVELLLICGDFQAMRSAEDLRSMACPDKCAVARCRGAAQR